jgi:putative transposase
VAQELLLRNEYVVTENRILHHQITSRVQSTDGDRKTLAAISHKLSKQDLQEVATIVKPDTILAWHRKLMAQKFDGSKQQQSPGRPKIDPALETLIVRMAQENRSWGYDRIVGALVNLGYTVSDQTVGNILKRHGIPLASERQTTTTGKEFFCTHMDVLVATDFFTAEVWTTAGLATYYVLFFVHLAIRKVHVAGVTPHPEARWMVQVGRNVTMAEWGALSAGQYLIHERDGKYCPACQRIITDALKFRHKDSMSGRPLLSRGLPHLPPASAAEEIGGEPCADGPPIPIFPHTGGKGARVGPSPYPGQRSSGHCLMVEFQ